MMYQFLMIGFWVCRRIKWPDKSAFIRAALWSPPRIHRLAVSGSSCSAASSELNFHLARHEARTPDAYSRQMSDAKRFHDQKSDRKLWFVAWTFLPNATLVFFCTRATGSRTSGQKALESVAGQSEVYTLEKLTFRYPFRRPFLGRPACFGTWTVLK